MYRPASTNALMPVEPVYISVQRRPLSSAAPVAFDPSIVTEVGSRLGKSFAVANSRATATEALLIVGVT